MVPKKVLLIKDQTSSALEYKLPLEQAGFELVVAHDNCSAIQEVHNHNPDIILINTNLSDYNRWELIRLLHVKERTGHYPIIIISEQPDIRNKVRAIQEGAEDYITIPFKSGELIKRIQIIIDRNKTNKDLSRNNLTI